MSRVIRNLISGLKTSFYAAKRKPTFVGSDHYGNRYFEMTADGKHNLRAHRFIEESKNRSDMFEVPKIPVEWNSWLRMTRTNPPTEEEIQRNYAQLMQTKLRAEQLEKGFKAKEIEGNDSSLPITENISPESHQSQFPIYPGFETKPGQKNR